MNTKHRIIKRICWMLTLAFVLALPLTALAADLSVSADVTSVKAGDIVTVTVTVTDSRIAVADGVFTYDPALLSYIGSDGGASDGYINLVSAQKGGSSSLTAVIKFNAAAAGEAEIRVTMQSIRDYDGNALSAAEAGVNISIAASDTPTDPGETQAVDISLTGVAAENVTGATQPMYIWRSLSSLTLPSGYADRQVTYRGEYVGGAAIPDSEDIILLYLSEKTGENAGYYIYDEPKDTLTPYMTVSSVSKSYTLIWPDESITAPEGYEPTTLELKEKEAPAWMPNGGDGTLYLVYARNSAGERGWYLYDTELESIQRYIPVSGAASPTPQQTPEPTVKPASAPTAQTETLLGIPLTSTVFIALGGGCTLLAVLMVVFLALFVRASRAKRKAADMGKRFKKASGELEVADYRFVNDKSKDK